MTANAVKLFRVEAVMGRLLKEVPDDQHPQDRSQPAPGQPDNSKIQHGAGNAGQEHYDADYGWPRSDYQYLPVQ